MGMPKTRILYELLSIIGYLENVDASDSDKVRYVSHELVKISKNM